MVLTETIRDNFRNPRLKQSLLPCLGEFVFYAATQEETEGRVNESWEVPGKCEISPDSVLPDLRFPL